MVSTFWQGAKWLVKNFEYASDFLILYKLNSLKNSLTKFVSPCQAFN